MSGIQEAREGNRKEEINCSLHGTKRGVLWRRREVLERGVVRGDGEGRKHGALRDGEGQKV